MQNVINTLKTAIAAMADSAIEYNKRAEQVRFIRARGEATDDEVRELVQAVLLAKVKGYKEQVNPESGKPAKGRGEGHLALVFKGVYRLQDSLLVYKGAPGLNEGRAFRKAVTARSVLPCIGGERQAADGAGRFFYFKDREAVEATGAKAKGVELYILLA